jgi:hypothetical protein
MCVNDVNIHYNTINYVLPIICDFRYICVHLKAKYWYYAGESAVVCSHTIIANVACLVLC